MTGPTPSITCPDCGWTSPNPNDVREGYCGHCHAWTSGEDTAVLRTFTVYAGVSDVAAPFCVREFLIRSGTGPIPCRLWPADSLEQARALVPAYAGTPLHRAPTDDPTIIETWI